MSADEDEDLAYRGGWTRGPGGILRPLAPEPRICGSVAGYKQHLRLCETTCPACRDAMLDLQRHPCVDCGKPTRRTRCEPCHRAKTARTALARARAATRPKLYPSAVCACGCLLAYTGEDCPACDWNAQNAVPAEPPHTESEAA